MEIRKEGREIRKEGKKEGRKEKKKRGGTETSDSTLIYVLARTRKALQNSTGTYMTKQ